MDPEQEKDPFLWDADRLLRELCTPDRTWDPPPAFKFPNPDILANKLVDLEIDGESLLTYRDIIGSLEPLMRDLSIYKVPHQLTFGKVVRLFQACSPAYRRWKECQDGMQDGSDVVKDEKPPKPLSNDRSGSPVSDQPKPNANGRSITSTSPGPGPGPGSDSNVSFRSLIPEPLPSRADTTTTEGSSALQSEIQPGILEHDTADQRRPSAGPSAGPFASEEPPKKKQKRVAPTIISTAPRNDPMSNFIPTEADLFTQTETIPPYPQDSPEEHGPSFAYLGAGKLTFHDMFGPDQPSDQDPDHQFSWAKPGFAPPGRQLQVNRAMKKYLRHVESAANNPSTRSEEDEVLPLFGESDTEYDSDTYREMEKEEEERLKAAASERAMLSEDEVTSGIRDAIQTMADLWAETKKPGWDRKAYRLWEQHKRAGTRKLVLAKAVSRRQRLDARIAQICKEISRDKWRNSDELRRQALSLEPSVFDREYERWLIKMLSNHVEPLKPHMLPKQRPQVKKPAPLPEGDEEILTTDSEGEPDDFIVDDDDDEARGMGFPLNDPMDLDPVLENSPAPSSSGPSTGDARSFQIDHKTPTSDEVDFDLTQIEDQTTTVDHAGPSQLSGTKDKPIDLPASSIDPTPEALDVIPGLDDPAALAKVGLAYWEDANDSDRLVAALLYTWDPSRRASLLNYVKEIESHELWQDFILRPTKKEALSICQGQITDEDKIGVMLARLFDVYISCSSARARETTRLRAPTIDRIKQHSSFFDNFCQLLRRIEPHLPAPSTPPTPIKLKTSRTVAGARDEDNQEVEKGYDAEEDVEIGSSDSGDDMPLSPANKRRLGKVTRNKEAQGLRETNLRQKEEYEERRRLLRERLAASGTVPDDMTQFIINDAKHDDQGFIYVHDHIAGRIKPHQVEGVRFMWNQFVVVRQGCLLAQTMGLGKTMQVITLLVAIAEASRSEDPSISSQIPSDLGESKTLVLCPAGLVDNWVDELLIWAPQDAAGESPLGTLSRVNSALSPAERNSRIRRWAKDGGVLVIGYTMFCKVSQNEDMAELLWQQPNIVVADEAHHLKNRKSQIHQATAHFRTKSRLAMTGTPLANNVKDYYAMINWVAPNYLSTPSEFDAVYDRPIKHGLFSDSSASDKRKALKMLNILKETVAPKVHRMGIAALKADLPTKKEFVIYLRLTDIQMAAYQAYVDHVNNSDKIGCQMTKVSKIWSFVAILSSLLAHPRIFRERLQKRKDIMATAERRRSTPATPTDGDENDDVVDLPQPLLSDVLATVSTRNIENYALSWKITLLIRILDEAQRVGDKVLVFSQLIPTLDFLQEIFRRQKRNFSRLDGDTPVAERQSRVKNFNNENGADVYLISTRAGGVGLNIYGANRVVIFDFKYVPTEEQQAVGRAYRIGQRKPVFVYWLIAGGTYETVVQNRSVFKSQLASRVVDKKNPVAWSKRNGNYLEDPKIPPKAKNLSEYLGKDSILDVLLNSEDLADGIRSIIMTETFEEEEPDDHILTSEDRQEVSYWVAKNKLRHQQQGHTGLPLHMRQNRVQPTPLVTAIDRPTANGFALRSADWAPALTATPLQPPQAPDAQQRMISPVRPSNDTVRNGHPAPAHTLGRSPGLSPPAVARAAPQTALPEVTSQPPQTKSPHSASPSLPLGIIPDRVPQPTLDPRPVGTMEPVTGTGTRIRTRSNSPPQQPETSAGPNANAVEVNLETKKEAFLQELTANYHVLRTEGRNVVLLPAQIVAELQKTLDSQPQPIKGMVLLDHWASLLKAIHDTRVAVVLLSGYLEPQKLAIMPRNELDRIAARYKAVPKADFNAMVWNRKDSDHLHANMQRSISGLNVGMQVLSPRTTGATSSPDRQPRLPGWAQRELAKQRSTKRSGSTPSTPSTPEPHPQLRPGDSIYSPHIID